MKTSAKHVSVVFGLALALVGCDEIAMPGAAPAAGGLGGSSAPREYLVLGSNMGFEECRARGGLIIRDSGSPMVACDPRVRGTPVPAGEFDHPGSPVPQVTAEG
ncbi:hypothetical protein L0664_02635 [Octadecabacter sp. G9-8]|uniref:Lipoprotein n=1 Tax=Octadecabacter dasysiphoniae TaxID=2909341 RepID=A0ABS9CRY4_9RHOB|nr:hypothetical protein [Octadecabacter dasysiphoniae]MCF2869953.1 hypothetical protein [Octadecabacter dasysiphoniae]